MPSIRQEQVARIIKDAMNEIFTRRGRDIYGAAFVTITNVTITADLYITRFYLSVYNVKEKQEVVDMITANNAPLRRLLAQKIKNKVRRIPVLEFYLDETLDEATKMEQLLDDLREERKTREPKDVTEDQDYDVQDL